MNGGSVSPRRGTATSAPGVGFLIIGTPRSGTTLVQRLTAELPGVAIPPETHFFRFLDPARLRRLRFPLDAPGIRGVLGEYRRLDVVRDLDLDPERVVVAMGGMCRSPIDLFEAVVREIAGPAELYGEKSPPHLLWWAALARARPSMKIVAVVRDPRAVVASNLAVPWGMSSPAVLAEQWAADQREVLTARSSLGAERCLVLRYETVVAEPDEARRVLAVFLGIHAQAPGHREDRRRVFLPWEEGWKGRAVQEVTADRVEAWKGVTPPATIREVTWICAPEMRAFGYEVPTPVPAVSSSMGDRIRRVHFRAARRRRGRRIHRLDPAVLGGSRVG